MNDRRGRPHRPGGGGPPGRGGSPPAPASQPPADYPLPLPPATVAAWRQHRGSRLQNPGLVFDRFVPGLHDAREAAPLKQQGLQAVKSAAEAADAALFAAWGRRWTAGARFAGAEPFTLRSDWRLITGLGEKGPLEVGFAFHRYGFPYLPGSGLKGLARSAALFDLADRLGDGGLDAAAYWRGGQGQGRRSDEGSGSGMGEAGTAGQVAALAALLELENAERFAEGWAALGAAAGAARGLAEQFRAVFGTTSRAGRAVFLDAIPEALPKLDLDIMNPHVPDYYREGLTGRTPPTNWQSPVPVYFLTVAPHTAFWFAVGWRGGPPAPEDRPAAQQARAWLIAGLTEQGAGGKTGAGYGFFEPPRDTDPPVAASTTTGTAQPPSPDAAPQPAPVEEAVLEWRKGTVAEYQPGPGRGRLRDDATSTEYRFTRDTIVDRGWSPGRKNLVEFVLEERDGAPVVVRVRKPAR